MAEYVVPWADILEYLRDSREAVIREMASADGNQALWAAQGKLALLEELLTLKDVFATMAQQKEETAKARSPMAVRARVTELIGATNAERFYGKDKGSQASGKE